MEMSSINTNIFLPPARAEGLALALLDRALNLALEDRRRGRLRERHLLEGPRRRVGLEHLEDDRRLGGTRAANKDDRAVLLDRELEVELAAHRVDGRDEQRRELLAEVGRAAVKLPHGDDRAPGSPRARLILVVDAVLEDGVGVLALWEDVRDGAEELVDLAAVGRLEDARGRPEQRIDDEALERLGVGPPAGSSSRRASMRLEKDVTNERSVPIVIFDLHSTLTNWSVGPMSFSTIGCRSEPSLVREASHETTYGFQPKSASET